MKEGFMSSSLTRRLTGVVVLLAAFAFAVSAFAQTGGVTGKCIGEDGKPLVGYTIQLERQEMRWTSHVKTDKKGEYTYIGLPPGNYKVTLLNPAGGQLFSLAKHVGLGDPTEVDFDVAKEKAAAYKELMANPEAAKKVEEQQKEQKQFTGLKATFDQATLLYNQQRFAEAAAMYEKALPLAKDKNLIVVLGRLGDSYQKAASKEPARDGRIKDQQEAIDYCQKAIQLDPNDGTLHGTLGSVYADMGKVAEAQAELQKAADLNPAGASGYYYNLGVIMYNKGRMDEAAAALKKCTELDPKFAEAYYHQGLALLGKATLSADGKVVPVPGTVEALAKRWQERRVLSGVTVQKVCSFRQSKTPEPLND
jgi:tetratricopeptide (TPR) repeat protein